MTRVPIGGAILVTLVLVPSARADDALEALLPPAAERTIDFERDIQPILTQSCLACHGPQQRKAGLRLDRKEDLFRGGDSGPPFEPGHSAESLLIEYVAAIDPDWVMPPEGEGERLTPQQVSLLRAWIDQGAAWPDGLELSSAERDEATPGADHWAFQPVRRPEVPEVSDRDWVRNPIDAFVLSKLEALGVEPSPEADKATLIRRLSLDLLGLPPSPEQVDAFLNDDRPDAYEHLVDRLLASPHFGERWGRHWLDLARYADSDGYEKDSPRPHAWRYRQWVIEAWNRDLPFDQFTIEQLAGDLLPDATLDQKIATGFHRNTLTNKEGGVDPEEFRVAAVYDRVDTTGTVWLGLTVACAQCHTHKYDPITQREYFGLFAFFNTSQEVDIPAPLPREQHAYQTAKAAFDAAHAPLVAALAEDEAERRPARQAAWEASLDRNEPGLWTVLEPVGMASSGGATLETQADGSILVSGTRAATDTYTLVVETDLAGITALRLEALDDPSLPAHGPGRAGHGNFVLSEVTVEAGPKDCGECPCNSEPAVAALPNASATFSQERWDVTGAIDGDPTTGWAVAPRFGARHVAVFETQDDLAHDGGTRLTITLDHQYGSEHTLGRFRVAATTAPRPVIADDLPDDVIEILALAPDQRSDEQAARLAEYHRTIDPISRELTRAVEEHATQAPPPPETQAQTLAEHPDPPRTHLHIRGDFLRKGDEVPPHTPQVLHPFKSQGENPSRLDLAHWLLAPDNPLTARVTVNRMWGPLFGRPLVPTVEDFGTRGEAPSHPELLDWLASEFRVQGWSQKAMIRLIVGSSTYRQVSHARAELIDRNPNNVWLARQGRFRMEAEVIRDLALASSGLLVPTVGGPSVRPPQPEGISDLTYAGAAKWNESTGPDRHRRGLYTWFQRTSPYPMLMTFDAPDGNVCTANRERSNTPLQALTLLNDHVFVECAQALGRRMIREEPSGDGPEERLRLGFRLCVSREPTAEELAVLVDLYETLLAECQADPKAASALVGDHPPADTAPEEAAAWVAVARTLMNLDEFVTRE